MASSAITKIKKYFALDGALPSDDHYMAEEAAFEERPAYGYDRTDSTTARYQPTRRIPQPSVVPVDVRSFATVKPIGEAFRDGNIVVFSLSDLPRAEARRVIDYAAGLCHGLRGQMKKLPHTSFGLIPEGIEVDAYELEEALDY